MCTPSALLDSYEYAGRIIDVYKNVVVLKSTGYLGEPVEYIFTKEPTEEHNVEYKFAHTLSAQRLGQKVYSNYEDKMMAVHLDLWLGV